MVLIDVRIEQATKNTPLLNKHRAIRLHLHRRATTETFPKRHTYPFIKHVGSIAILKLRGSKFKCRFLNLNVCVLGGLLEERNEQIAGYYQIMNILTVFN